MLRQSRRAGRSAALAVHAQALQQLDTAAAVNADTATFLAATLARRLRDDDLRVLDSCLGCATLRQVPAAELAPLLVRVADANAGVVSAPKGVDVHPHDVAAKVCSHLAESIAKRLLTVMPCNELVCRNNQHFSEDASFACTTQQAFCGWTTVCMVYHEVRICQRLSWRLNFLSLASGQR